MRILITGANGFIDRHLIDRLMLGEFGARVLVRDGSRRLNRRKGVEVLKGNVQKPEEMKTAAVGCDTVFHLAGKVHDISEVEGDEAIYNLINTHGRGFDRRVGCMLS